MRHSRFLKLVFIIILVGELVAPVPLANAEGDWEGPKFVSIEISPATLDVSTSAAYANIEVRVTDATGVKFVTLQFRTGLGGVGGGPDISLSKCNGSTTDCVMTGKLIFAKRYRPGSYALPSILMTDTLGNSSHNNSTNATINIFNSAGNPDPNEISRLPSGIQMEDYLPAKIIVNYKNAVTSLESLTAQVINTNSQAKVLNLAQLAFGLAPTAQISLTGDMYTDMDSVNAFVVNVQQYRDSLVGPLRQLEERIKLEKSKKTTQTITCMKGKLIKKITNLRPTCPAGFKLTKTK